MADKTQVGAELAYSNALNAKIKEFQSAWVSDGFPFLTRRANVAGIQVDTARIPGEEYRLELIRQIAESRARQELPSGPWVEKWLAQQAAGGVVSMGKIG